WPRVLAPGVAPVLAPSAARGHARSAPPPSWTGRRAGGPGRRALRLRNARLRASPFAASALRRGSARGGAAEGFLEQVDGAFPRELRRRLVVARRGVVVEAVLRARVAVHLELDLGRLQGLF